MGFGNAHRDMAYGPHIPEDPFLTAVNRYQAIDALQFRGRLDVYKLSPLGPAIRALRGHPDGRRRDLTCYGRF
jgi:hypothetical protein